MGCAAALPHNNTSTVCQFLDPKLKFIYFSRSAIIGSQLVGDKEGYLYLGRRVPVYNAIRLP